MVVYVVVVVGCCWLLLVVVLLAIVFVFAFLVLPIVVVVVAVAHSTLAVVLAVLFLFLLVCVLSGLRYPKNDLQFPRFSPFLSQNPFLQKPCFGSGFVLCLSSYVVWVHILLMFLRLLYSSDCFSNYSLLLPLFFLHLLSYPCSLPIPFEAILLV